MIGKLAPVGILLALCTLPAQGADPPNATAFEVRTLTPIDSVPTKEEIISVAGADPVSRLRDLALAPSTDFGVRLRAIRALPVFCSSVPSCKDLDDANMHPARLAVRDVIAGVSPTDHDGHAILQLRAAIESLGVVKSGKQSDIDLLIPFLSHPSRDIRVATARALRDICLPTATSFLRARYDQEPVAQVRLAISGALGDLDQCSP